MCQPGSEGQRQIRAAATEKMQKTLAHKPEILETLLPIDFGIGCRRLTPGPGFLEALGSENVHHVKERIVQVTEDSIIDATGKARKVDAIICATGFDNSFAPRIHMEGRDGFIYGTDFASNPKGYLAMGLAHMPNHFVMFGPNCCGANGSAIIVFEECVEYMIKFVRKMQREDIASFCVKPELLDEFCAVRDAIFDLTVFKQPCKSWFKQGRPDGPVSGCWPGSSLHYTEMLQEPRWEDFDWTYTHSSRFSYIGNGRSTRENLGLHRSQHLVDRLNKYDEVKKRHGVPVTEIDHQRVYESPIF